MTPDRIQFDELADPSGVIDDVVLTGWMHMEMLDDDHAYLHVWRDGDDSPVTFEINATRAKPRGKPVLRIRCTDERDVPTDRPDSRKGR